MQTVWAGHGDRARLISIPNDDEEVIDGVRWGSAENPGTPAYWAVRCQWDEIKPLNFASGANSLVEEVGFCLLGGYSVTFETNMVAFDWLRSKGVFDLNALIPESKILELLLQPLEVNGRLRRYRFPNQRARRIASMRERMLVEPPGGDSPRALRDHLLQFDGIGPKTASWVVRNHLDSDDVAILDVHVLRACRGMGLFPEEISLPRDYGELEGVFLDFAKAIRVRSSVLDAVMWAEMRGGIILA